MRPKAVLAGSLSPVGFHAPKTNDEKTEMMVEGMTSQLEAGVANGN